MLQRLNIAKEPNTDLLLAFILQVTPQEADKQLVEFASYQMQNRLAEKHKQGYTGWHTPQCENSALKTRLLKNVESEDWVDVINLAAMLLARSSMFTEVELKLT